MGLPASIYTAHSGGGDVTIVNADGPFDPTEKAPAVLLIVHPTGDLYGVIAVPAEPDGVGGYRPVKRPGTQRMASGAFVYSGDSRFGRAVRSLTPRPTYASTPVSFHDRFETVR